MLFATFLIAVSINIFLFVPAYFFRTDKLTDFSYGLSFIVVSLFTIASDFGNLAKLVLLAMIVIWALRLISYLVIRIGKIKRDERFDGIRENFFKFAYFWLFQGISVWVILLPSTIFLSNGSELTTLSFVGIAVWLVGLLTEASADLQKYKFINDPKNKGKWIASGLWKYSRHPNYFGEILVWVGIFLFSLPALSGINIWLGIASPLYISFLLIFVSGIPKLERRADERWGDDPAYQEYKRRTSILVPFFNRRP